MTAPCCLLEGFPIPVDLADRGLIRLLDLALARKETDGSVTAVATSDLDGDGDGELDLAVFDVASGAQPGCGSARVTPRGSAADAPA